jgi:hypothetical protein
MWAEQEEDRYDGRLLEADKGRKEKDRFGMNSRSLSRSPSSFLSLDLYSHFILPLSRAISLSMPNITCSFFLCFFTRFLLLFPCFFLISLVFEIGAMPPSLNELLLPPTPITNF